MADTTYDDVTRAAKELLFLAGKLTIAEHREQGLGNTTSANETLGMATRAIAEQAKLLQAMGDAEEARSV